MHENKALAALLALGLLGVCTIALAQTADGSDSMRVGDMQYGNALDPRGWTPLLTPDPQGFSWLHAGTMRTPSGALYLYPPSYPEELADDGWISTLHLSLGYLHVGGDSDAEFFRQYAGWKNGFALGLIDLEMANPKTGGYADFRGSRLSADDQFYRMRAGRWGDYKVEAFYRDMPHIVSTDAYPIWNGIGTTNLTLPAALIPGDSTIAAIKQASQNAPRRDVGLTRKRQGLSVEGRLYRNWIGYISVVNEQRNGTRLWGGSMFFNYYFAPPFENSTSPYGGNGGINETVRPIDFSTTDINIGLRNVGTYWHFNAVYTGSFFRDNKDRLDYQSPFLITPAVHAPALGLVYQGEFSLEPDNDYHNLRLELSRELKWQGELSFAAAWGTMRQNDSLLPPLTCTGNLGFSGGPFQQIIPCADWNTTAALSETSAHARIDTGLFYTKLSFHPSRNFSWHGELRYYDEDNKTRYLSYNPLTGQFGYISENGSQGTVVPGQTGIFDLGNYRTADVQIANMPFGYRDTRFELGGDWKLGAKNTVNLVYTFDDNHPVHRERKRLDEQRFKLSWVSRSLGRATLRSSLEFGDRYGGPYNFDPYAQYFSESLPGYVPADGIASTAFTVDAMRMYDMSNRREIKGRSVLIYPVGTTTTVSATLYGSLDRYSALIGRQNTGTMGFTAQWNWQPAPQTTASAYLGYASTRLKLANVNDNENEIGNPGGSDPAFGGPLYPFQNYWYDVDREINYNAGLTYAHSFGHVRLNLGWNYTMSLSQLNYAFASAAALTHPEAAPLLDGAFPNNHYRDSALDARLTFPLARDIGMTLFGRYETGSFLDWHYLGFDDTLVYDHKLYTDKGPQAHFNASVIGLLLNVAM